MSFQPWVSLLFFFFSFPSIAWKTFGKVAREEGQVGGFIRLDMQIFLIYMYICPDQ